MIYNPFVKFESKLIPGVVYTLRKMSRGRRTELNLDAIPVYKEMDELAGQINILNDEYQRAQEAAKLEPCTCTHSMEPVVLPEGTELPKGTVLEDDGIHVAGSGRCLRIGCDCRKPQMNSIIGTEEDINRVNLAYWDVTYGKLYPILIRWGVAGVDGLKLLVGDKEVVPTPEQLIDLAPEDLLTELGKAVHDLVRVSPADLRDFKWPTTSGDQVDRQTNDTTVSPAIEPSTTSTGIAEASFLKP